MIDNRDNVPSAYGDKSRDYQVLLKLFDLVCNFIKLDIDAFKSLLNPESCPDHMLPLLASFMEYSYDYNETFNANRLIMKYYPKLLRNKGNEIGLKSSVLLSCNISDKDTPNLNKIIADYDYANATIYVYYPGYLNKVRDLIEVTRPAGMRVILLSYDEINAVEVVQIYDDLLIVNSEEYTGQLASGDYYILDESERYIIGIGQDTRSVISDDYRKNGTTIIPNFKDGDSYTSYYKKPNETLQYSNQYFNGRITEVIDKNNYLKSISREPELEEKVDIPINADRNRVSRIGFSEVTRYLPTDKNEEE